MAALQPRLYHGNVRILSCLHVAGMFYIPSVTTSPELELQLLRNPVTYTHLNESTALEIYESISQTADAYHDASSPASTSAAYHSRFLRSLVTEDVIKPRRTEKRKENSMPIDPRLQGKISINV